MQQTYFVISQVAKAPGLARFNFGAWKRKKDSFVCDVELQIGKSLKWKKKENGNDFIEYI